MTTIAARISHGMLASEVWNSAAVPEKLRCTDTGRPISASAAAIAGSASLRLMPGARLKDKVAAGSWPSWLSTSGPRVVVAVATADSGTSAPVFDFTYSWSSASGRLRNAGGTSSTTRYWVTCVKMVVTWRWPKASYSASSMACTGTPSREARSRWISSFRYRPSVCCSVVTSASSGRAFSAAISFGVHSASSLASRLRSPYWYWVRAMRLSICRSCTGCMNRLMPSTAAARCLSRSITWSAEAERSLRGFSTMFRRPVLSVGLMLPLPTKAATLATSGSWRTASLSAIVRAFIAGNEMLASASATPTITPVSCCGSRPLGMATNNRPVASSVRPNTVSVCFGRAITQRKDRS